MREFHRYFSKINVEQPILDCPWVSVKRSNTQTGKVWRLVFAHYLTGAENTDNHHIFADTLDANGQLLQHPQASIGWTWDGRRDDEPAPPVSFDKQPPEPLANLPMFQGQHISMWLEGAYDSDVVSNLRSDPPTADEPGNKTFHKSIYLIFQLLDASATHTEPGDNGGTGDSDLAKRVAALEKAAADVEYRLKLVENFIGAKG